MSDLAMPALNGLPAGFGIVLDSGTRQLGADLWFGGSPARVVRLTPAGRAAWNQLRDNVVRSAASGRLGRRFTDAGLAHPVPPREPSRRGDTTVIVAVYDRTAQLRRCLAALGSGHPVVIVDDGSRAPEDVDRLGAQFGADVVHLSRNAGPAAARNAGLARVTSEFVAFLDSDCEPPPNWIDALLPHLLDPLVGAVAPRIRPLAADTWSGRYTRARSSLDQGVQPARVAPGMRVSYVPTAALVARRSALVAVARCGDVFDPTMRVGEDVDLVWRLHDAGWRIRYDPCVQVGHREPTTWAALLGRRLRYGSSAGLLARSHPRKVAPLVLHPWPTLVVLGLLARRPAVAAAGFAVGYLTMARTLRRRNVPQAGLLRANLRAARQTWTGVGRWCTQFAWPVPVAAVVLPGDRWRRVAAATLLLGPPLEAWLRDRPPLDAARFLAGSLADDVAYGTGVIVGSVRQRTTAPVRPRVAWRVLRIDDATTTPTSTTARSTETGVDPR